MNRTSRFCLLFALTMTAFSAPVCWAKTDFDYAIQDSLIDEKIDSNCLVGTTGTVSVETETFANMQNPKENIVPVSVSFTRNEEQNLSSEDGVTRKIASASSLAAYGKLEGETDRFKMAPIRLAGAAGARSIKYPKDQKISDACRNALTEKAALFRLTPKSETAESAEPKEEVAANALKPLNLGDFLGFGYVFDGIINYGGPSAAAQPESK